MNNQNATAASETEEFSKTESLLAKISEMTAQLEANERDRGIQRALFRIADITTAAENMDTFYRSLHQIVTELTSTDAFYIAIYDEEQNAIKFAYYEDDYDDIQLSVETPLNNRGFIPVAELKESLTWKVIRTNDVLRVVDNGLNTSRGIGKLPQDWLGLPLQKNGRPVGVVAIQSYQEGFRYTDSEIELMTFISQHIATALHRRQDAVDLKKAAAELEATNDKLKLEMIERESINQRLLQLSHQAGKAEVATGVLHNVGNVLNSINVSANLVTETHRLSRVGSLKKATELLLQQEDVATFLTEDERGQMFPTYLSKLADKLLAEHDDVFSELQTLSDHLDHVKTVVAMQQCYAGVSGLKQSVSFSDLFDDAELLIASSLARHEIQVKRDFADLPEIMTEKQKLLQVLVNLLKNAKDAINASRTSDKRLSIRTYQEGDKVKIEVADNGGGIDPANLTKIFSHGFTTKDDGHGFGLHASANAIREMGGQLSASSEGLGKGAVFAIELPIDGKKEN